MEVLRVAATLLRDLLERIQSPPVSDIGLWTLALVFAWSGLTKVTRPKLAALAIADFGVARHPRMWQGLALGTGEVLLGATLSAGWFARGSLAVAAAVLLIFTALISYSLLKGRSFPCFCFGNEQASISATTLARTICLALLAVVLWTAPRAAADHGFLNADTWSHVVSAIAVLGIIVLLSRVPRLLRWNRETVAHFRRQKRMEETVA